MYELSRPDAVPPLADAKLPLFGGYGLELVFEESRKSSLFDSLRSAQLFARFSQIYVNDAFPGNSYGGVLPS